MLNSIHKTVLSGVQPSGNLHIGNYLGAISQWVALQKDYHCLFCIVDYHAITVHQNPADLRRRILEVAKTYLALGVNPEHSAIFQQSQISGHTELGWILNCIARIADLNKMTQFKDKAGKNQESVSVGLYDYPVLMAADILLYQTDLVPVGDDQVQHVELARDLAHRFNERFGATFKIPEALVRKEGARIMGLDDASKKMSKSAPSVANYIALLDSPEEAAKKIKRAVTDSGSEIKFDRINKPAVSNLLTIYSLLSATPITELEIKYQTSGYGVFKEDLARATGDFLARFQKDFNAWTDSQVSDILNAGAETVYPLAQATLNDAKKKIGLL